METQLNNTLTEQDIKMLWSLRDGQIPSLYGSQVKILDTSVDYTKLNETVERRILSNRVSYIGLTEEDGKVQPYYAHRNYLLGVDPEVVCAHAKSMGRKNTWANRRWRDRSDNFFGEGFIGPEYHIKPYVRAEDKKADQYIVAEDMILPSRLKIVLPETAARKFFSNELEKATTTVTQLEDRLKDITGKEIPASKLPFNEYELHGTANEGYKTHPIFSPLWAHGPRLNENGVVVAQLYLENEWGNETVYHIKEHDERDGVFGELTFSPLLSNGESADANALQRYSAFLGRKR